MATNTAQVRKFVGIYNQQMPFIQTGLVPATAEDIMRLRLQGQLSFDEYYDTISGIAYSGSEQDKFKIILSSQALKDINPETELHNGGVKQTQEQYDAIQAQEFTRKDMLLSKRLTQDQVLEHPGWLVLAGENTELLGKYAEKVFKQVYDRSNEREAMGFYIRDLQETPNLRALCFSYLGRRFDAHDSYGFYDDARLVGVGAEGASQIVQPNLEQILAITRDLIPEFAKEEFEKRLRVLY